MTNTGLLRTAQLDIEGRRFEIDLGKAHDLAIALDFNGTQPGWFGGPPARSVPLALGSFSGRVERGSSCNCSTLSLTPHCDGTHTECVGHLTAEPLNAREVVPVGFLPALLLTIAPVAAGSTEEGSRPAPQARDHLITRTALLRAWPVAPAFVPNALVVRTLPNPALKRARDYLTQPAAYLSLQAAHLLVERGIEHLVLDVPSADRADDDGLLSAHRAFFGLEPGSSALAAARRPQCTITELAYIDAAVVDGSYVLSLQIPALGGDAVPSRPLLFPVRPA